MPRLQVNLIGIGARTASSWVVTTQWAVSALPTPGALATALANIRTALVASTPFKASIGSNYQFVSLKALAYATPGAPASFTVDSGGAAVAGTGAPLIPPLAVVVSEQTAAAGASFRGRSYFPGSGATAPSSQGTLTTVQQQAVRSGWLAAHNAILAGLATLGGGPVHVVYSRKTGDMTPIVVIRTGDRIDTARGRFGDTPETYVSEAVPSSVAIALAPEGDEVDAGVLGIGEDATEDEVADYLEALAAHLGDFGPLTLGPLKELYNFAQTILQLRRAD
jgi:hypothetical protein